jgi:hypothetical protein
VIRGKKNKNKRTLHWIYGDGLLSSKLKLTNIFESMPNPTPATQSTTQTQKGHQKCKYTVATGYSWQVDRTDRQNRQTDRQGDTDRQADRQTDRQTRQAGRKTDRQALNRTQVGTEYSLWNTDAWQSLTSLITKYIHVLVQ